MSFRMVNCPNLRWQIPRNFPGGGKFPLNISIAPFMLISYPIKFHNILIVRSTRTCRIPQQLTEFKVHGQFDRRSRSIRKKNGAQDRSFLIPLYLLQSLGWLLLLKKSTSKSWDFFLVLALSWH